MSWYTRQLLSLDRQAGVSDIAVTFSLSCCVINDSIESVSLIFYHVYCRCQAGIAHHTRSFPKKNNCFFFFSPNQVIN